MSVTNDDLQNFYQFALTARDADVEASIEQLVSQWRASKERESVHEAIRSGLEEIEAGGGRPFEDFFVEMKAKYNLSVDV
jgi:hypothetical protein